MAVFCINRNLKLEINAEILVSSFKFQVSSFKFQVSSFNLLISNTYEILPRSIYKLILQH